MSFICNKLINGKKYAYEVTSIWDSKAKKVKKKNKYLGVVCENGTIKKKASIRDKHYVLDFGDGYLIYEFIKKTPFYNLLMDTVIVKCPEIVPLIVYKVCCQSAMYNAGTWFEGNILSVLAGKLSISSQNISSTLEYLGTESVQREFFLEYLKLDYDKNNNVVIDATSLPNQSSHYFNSWGRADGHIEKQFRFLCVVNQQTKNPLYYRFLPGNIIDITTLKNTIAELRLLGATNNFVLLDAGYVSKMNIKELYENKIDFLTRLPSGRVIYKKIIENELHDIEKVENGLKCGDRVLFVKQINYDLYGNNGYAYIVIDPTRRGAELNKVISEYLDKKSEKSEEKDDQAEENAQIFETDILLKYKFKKSGIMILISSKNIDKNDVVSTYYMRQIIEQVFGFFKCDLDSLPIRSHNDLTIRGYLFLQFLVLIIYIHLRSKIQHLCTVEQAVLTTRNLKCKVFDNEILVNELTKKQSEIYKSCDIMVPKNLGI